MTNRMTKILDQIKTKPNTNNQVNIETSKKLNQNMSLNLVQRKTKQDSPLLTSGNKDIIVIDEERDEGKRQEEVVQPKPTDKMADFLDTTQLIKTERMVDSTSDDVNLHKKSLALSDTRRTEANSTPQFKLTQRDKEQLKASYSDYKDDINNLIDTLVAEEFPVDNVAQHIEQDKSFNKSRVGEFEQNVEQMMNMIDQNKKNDLLNSSINTQALKLPNNSFNNSSLLKKVESNDIMVTKIISENASNPDDATLFTNNIISSDQNDVEEKVTVDKVAKNKGKLGMIIDETISYKDNQQDQEPLKMS